MAVASGSPADGDHGRTAAPERGTVEHVVVDERRSVYELDRDRGPHEPVGLRRRRPGGDAYQQRPQSLAPGGDRVAGIAREHRSVTGRELRHSRFHAFHHAREGLASGVHHCLCASTHQVGTTPTCKAMMPPAVST